MSTSVEAKRRRTVGLESFAHITSVPVAEDGIQPDGVLFDGDLTDDEVIAVWWFLTSADDTEEQWRRAIAADIFEAETKPYNETTKWLTTAYAKLARHAIRYGTEGS